MPTSRVLNPNFKGFHSWDVRWDARALEGSLRIETAKFSKPSPKGRVRYYLRRKWDAGLVPCSATTFIDSHNFPCGIGAGNACAG